MRLQGFAAWPVCTCLPPLGRASNELGEHMQDAEDEERISRFTLSSQPS